MAEKCDFKLFLDESLRDQFVVGIKDESIQQKLLNESSMDFEKACQIAKSLEITKNSMQLLHPNSIHHVGYHTVNKNKFQRSRTPSTEKKHSYQRRNDNRSPSQQQFEFQMF